MNPLLKPNQVAYILKDCNVRILITSCDRLTLLSDVLTDCHDLRAVVVVEEERPSPTQKLPYALLTWAEFVENGSSIARRHRRIDSDMAAILYTSGSTGRPKGVVLSHRNMVAGARSVAQYLKNSREDRLLAALPFSFDS